MYGPDALGQMSLVVCVVHGCVQIMTTCIFLSLCVITSLPAAYRTLDPWA